MKRFKAKIEEAPRLPFEAHEISLGGANIPFDLGRISSIARDAQGSFFILHRNLEVDPVVVLDSDGKFLRSFGKGRFKIPHSIRVDAEEKVWTADSGNSQVYGFTKDGQDLAHFDIGEMPEIARPFKGTADVAFGAEGSVYIADGYGNSRVLVYSKVGQRLREWGKKGDKPGEFNLVHGITTDQDGNVFVADRENARIQKFTANGDYIASWGDLGRVYSLHHTQKTLWVGTQRIDRFGDSWGWILKLDPDTGRLLGVLSAPGTHSIHHGPGCEFTVASGSDRLVVMKLWPRESCNTVVTTRGT